MITNLSDRTFNDFCQILEKFRNRPRNTAMGVQFKLHRHPWKNRKLIHFNENRTPCDVVSFLKFYEQLLTWEIYLINADKANQTSSKSIKVALDYTTSLGIMITERVCFSPLLYWAGSAESAVLIFFIAFSLIEPWMGVLPSIKPCLRIDKEHIFCVQLVMFKFVLHGSVTTLFCINLVRK